VVCECAGHLVGLNGVALTYETGQNLITGICVDPAHQGHGVGTALLGRGLEWLRDCGLSHATVTTEAQSKAARIYAHFGSVRTDHVDPGDAPKPS
jgi:GNAT superfamily N-acetyltransferase